MGPGEIMGEESLIADQPSQARFVALTACVLYRLDKVHIQACLEPGGEVAEAMSRLHRFRLQASQSLLLQKPAAVHKAGFLSWLRKR
jgi:CRP-like cAMP-binding protein